MWRLTRGVSPHQSQGGAVRRSEPGTRANQICQPASEGLSWTETLGSEVLLLCLSVSSWPVRNHLPPFAWLPFIQPSKSETRILEICLPHQPGAALACFRTASSPRLSKRVIPGVGNVPGLERVWCLLDVALIISVSRNCAFSFSLALFLKIT